MHGKITSGTNGNFFKFLKVFGTIRKTIKNFWSIKNIGKRELRGGMNLKKGEGRFGAKICWHHENLKIYENRCERRRHVEFVQVPRLLG
jgi:hypothetical protein